MILNSPLSIATVIKRACLEKYDNYKDLNDNDKLIVALGANGILDLTKTDSPHKKILDSSVFSALNKKYPSSFEKVNVFDGIADANDIEKRAKVDLHSARALATKKESDSRGLESTVYEMYSEYLKILMYNKKVFRKDLDTTEGDYAVKVWGPLLEATFREEEDIRLKWGESVGDSSGVSESRGFKVGVRAVYDRYSARKNLKEADTANVEMAKADASISKLNSDRTKLFIENKCVVDRLLLAGIAKEEAIIPCLQVYGLKAVLYSVRLVENGLYVGVEEGKCTITNNETDLSSFKDVVNLLQSFKRSAINLIHLNSQETGEEKPTETRPTWIPPQQQHQQNSSTSQLPF